MYTIETTGVLEKIYLYKLFLIWKDDFKQVIVYCKTTENRLVLLKPKEALKPYIAKRVIESVLFESCNQDCFL